MVRSIPMLVLLLASLVHAQGTIELLEPATPLEVPRLSLQQISAPRIEGDAIVPIEFLEQPSTSAPFLLKPGARWPVTLTIEDQAFTLDRPAWWDDAVHSTIFIDERPFQIALPSDRDNLRRPIAFGSIFILSALLLVALWRPRWVAPAAIALGVVIFVIASRVSPTRSVVAHAYVATHSEMIQMIEHWSWIRARRSTPSQAVFGERVALVVSSSTLLDDSNPRLLVDGSTATLKFVLRAGERVLIRTDLIRGGVATPLPRVFFDAYYASRGLKPDRTTAGVVSFDRAQ